MVRPFILLQLSDLHFGEHSRFHGEDLHGLANRCATAIASACQDLGWAEQVELVLVTGDVAEAARPKEYRAALEFFSALKQALALAPSRFVFVPGNHDVSWTKCTEVQGLISDGELDEAAGRARIDKVKLARFDAMVAAFHEGTDYDEGAVERSGLPRSREAGEVAALARGAYVHDLPELFVSVAALNSCERESHRPADHVGFVSEEQAQEVLDHWRKVAPADRLRLIAVHHNPIASPPKQVKEWADWLRRKMEDKKISQGAFDLFAADVAGFEGNDYLRRIAEQTQVSLLLHGHHHVSDSGNTWAWRGAAPASGNTVLLSAGSWSLVPEKLPAEQPVVMQLVRVDPQNRQASAVLLRYEPRAEVAGKVTPGAFVLDEVTRRHSPLVLSIPAQLLQTSLQDNARAASEPSKPTKDAAAARVLEEAVKTYRARKQGAFKEWKVRGVGAGHGGKHRRPAEAELDEMYVPLEVALAASASWGRESPKPRFGAGGRRPMELTPEAVFAREASMALVGAAGSGKTTWMTWTFRRLLERPDALPFFLELRALTAGWAERAADRRTIDAVLEDELATCRIDSPRELLRGLLTSGTKLRPVLLVDGWDELGELGSDLRRRLDEFRGEHPHVLVVVSSRPYGEDRPAEAAGFDTFEIQPLSDKSIKRLVHQFHHRVDGEAEHEAAAATAELLTRLKAVPAAHALARTPLLLTMLMLLSREQPLPDKRHKLYDACLRNLLHAWPTQREHGGAKLLRSEWRPEDHEQRLRVVSKVAYELQAGNSWVSPSAAIVARRTAVVSLLPAGWSRDQREGFVEWLINCAGVLIDRSDDTITFAHLSFQEFLAAYYLFCTKEGDERRISVLEHATRPQWQESLRQLAGLLHDQDPGKLGRILAALGAQPSTTWLAGAILADGSGLHEDVARWAASLDASQIRSAQGQAFGCANSWASSQQQQRKHIVASHLATAAANAMWLNAIAIDEWCERSGIDWHLPAVLQELAAPSASEVALARSRAVLGAGWNMPGDGSAVLLRLWPSQRSRVAISLQTLVSVGGGVEALWQIAKVRLVNRCGTPESHSTFAGGRHKDGLLLELLWDFARSFDRAFGLDFGRDFLRSFVRDFGWDLLREFVQGGGPQFVRAFGRAFARGFGRDFAREFGRDFGKEFVWSFVKDFGRKVGHGFGRSLFFGAALQRMQRVGHASISNAWWPDFVELELESLAGRSSTRAVLARDSFVPIDAPSSELGLFRLACRASLHPTKDSSQLDAALADYQGDPLWPALARHLSRRSTAEDRALLEDLARHPEKREGVLSWCLRYYVRGDLLLQDGTVLTIDDLCDQIGLEPPPLLEDMPDELPLPDLT